MEKEIVSYIEANALAHPNDIILHGKTPTGWSDVTWKEFWDDVVSLSQTLISENIATGDRIVIFSQNMIQWHIVDMATMGIRAVTVPVYATSSPIPLTKSQDCESERLIPYIKVLQITGQETGV